MYGCNHDHSGGQNVEVYNVQLLCSIMQLEQPVQPEKSPCPQKVSALLGSLQIWFWALCKFGFGLFANLILGSLQIWFWALRKFDFGLFANLQIWSPQLHAFLHLLIILSLDKLCCLYHNALSYFLLHKFIKIVIFYIFFLDMFSICFIIIFSICPQRFY